MDIHKSDRFLVRAGFVLFTLALLTGFSVPLFTNPKMGLAAHLTGAMNALVLMALGLGWGLLTLSPMQAKIARVTFLYGTYANWGGSVLAAAWGTSRLTPLSGAGFSAAPWQETVVQLILISLSVVIVLGAVLVVYGLRPKPAAS